MTVQASPSAFATFEQAPRHSEVTLSVSSADEPVLVGYVIVLVGLALSLGGIALSKATFLVGGLLTVVFGVVLLVVTDTV